MLPILCTVFSRMVGDRLCSILMPLQAVDQAAYRKTFSTDDHTFVVTQVVEKSLEYNLPIWLVLIDYTKAFDTVEHTMLWKVLADQGVPPDFILLLQRLYTGAQAYVRTDVSSRSFRICRGVRQGDPISPLLFIAVMEHIFTRLKAEWQSANARRKGPEFGIRVSADGKTLTNLRFADDCI